MAVSYIRSDLEFILQQILIAEQHAAGADLTTLIPNAFVPFGLRTVDGSFNNLVPGNEDFGAADQLFPRLLDPAFVNDADGDTIDINGPAPGGTVTNTDYAQSGDVVDADPRIISNLIVDQTSNNPAAAAIAGSAGTDGIWGTGDDVLNDGVSIIRTTAGLDGLLGTQDDIAQFSFDNVAPDEGLSAPFNLWFVFFGQFFDHGLDLVAKGDSGTVFIPLQPDDPLVTLGPDGAAGTGDELPPPLRFMVLTRATNQPGPDGIVGDDPDTPDIDEGADDVHEHQNLTSPFVDQNQTYTSTASHQVFLREYALDADGRPVATGKLITNRDLVDGEFGNGNDIDLGGMSTWAVVKAQARDMLGIQLTDHDVVNVPLLKVDPYGNFIPGANGFAQIIIGLGADGIPQTEDDVVIEGNPAANGGLGVAVPLDAPRTGHMFLADIAHEANPFDSQDGHALAADSDNAVGLSEPGTYDDELLAEHFMAGDGRVNENVGLTAVHHVFHAEHNRLVEHTKEVALATGDVAFLNQWLSVPVTEIPADTSTLVWNGERLFQAAKFGTEMQYQHLVFEEFARKVQVNVDAFLAPEGFATQLDPAILAEFAHVVYRFGHSMLLDEVDRFDPTFQQDTGLGLIEAFLNPLAFDLDGTLSAAEAAGAIVRGTTRQVGNEIDEFKTEALRNNLLGLPLDLAAINLSRARDTGVPSLNAARREFYELTGDSQLSPYESWIDFMQGIEHPESLVNFIAAYGTHADLTAADVDTLAEKRAVAMALVLGGSAVINQGTLEERTFVADDADRTAFLNGTGIYANIDGLTTTGVDDVDFWIGGLAERIMPFGGFLGSTFNFVFETQLEALQNGDRLYYLSRLAGLNFLTELENNSFAKLIMANTDATHLPADVFSTPGFFLEVDQTRQFNAGLDSADPVHEDPTGLNALNPLVIRDNPTDTDNPLTPFNEATANYLQYTGPDHVVLGGTDGDDIMIASEGDDTLWGDGGNDRLEGGFGNDNIEGGAGDDIITDIGGDDILKGNEGNDVIQGGNGLNLILGGAGNDFIITGEDVSETFGGTGNDFIYGAPLNLPTFGNEGDDWIEVGTSDGAGGDNFDPQETSPVIGHDVFITGTGFDEVDGEGGVDIMVGSDGPDHFAGGGSFDWASYEHDRSGVKVDLEVNDFLEPPVPASNQGVDDRFADVEGLSGSAFSDILRGSNAEAADIDVAGTLSNALEAQDIALVDGLQELLNRALGPGTTRFASGDILLGGDGSDILEGRAGDDVIDGDSWLNVAIAVHANSDGTGPVLFTVQSMVDLIPRMLSGELNPGQLAIVREIVDSSDPIANPNGAAVNGFVGDFDTVHFSGNQTEYTIIIDNGGTPDDFTDDVATVVDNVAGRDGLDRLINVERLQFADSSLTLVPGVNSDPVGAATIDDTTPAVGQPITASVDLVTDPDNPGGGTITGPVAFVWQVERDPAGAPGVFEDIVDEAGGSPATQVGASFTATADLDGLRLRVKALYQDANGVIETVFSAPTQPVAAGAAPAPAPVLPDGSNVQTAGIHLITSDLQFILDQIKIAEAHAGGADPNDLVPNSRQAFGLRTVDGSFNNLVQGQSEFGASDNTFPRLLDPFFRNELDESPFPLGPAPAPVVTNTDYGLPGHVVDSDPRIISNLIADQTSNNPAAVAVAGDAGLDGIWGTGDDELNEGVSIIRVTGGADGVMGTTDDIAQFSFDNVAPDVGLSAPFNLWFVFFGQFFDHGLDLVQKTNTELVFIPLQPDDPLITLGPDGTANTGDELTNPGQQFMVLSRATTYEGAGADGILEDDPDTLDVDESADNTTEHLNQTSPFVDQNQTYASHASHQVFLRAYAFNANGDPVDTGRLITNHALNPDGTLTINADGTLAGDLGGMSTWAVVKAQARQLLGIDLTDADVGNVPLLATDAYGNFIRGENGFPQVVMRTAGDDGVIGTGDDGTELVEGNPLAPIDLTNAVRTGHMFLADIAHSANPFDSQTGDLLDPDTDTDTGPIPNPDFDPELPVGPGNRPFLEQPDGTYDDELLGEHFMAGDGRVNENVGLTAVHHIFHSEHNRLVGHIKDVILASAAPTATDLDGDVSFLNEWLLVDVTEVPADLSTLVWDGQRVFQAARFGTEMQYQHLVFEEFARKIQPQIDIFLQEGQGYDTTIDASIVAEFAHVVYRFGHSMLLDEVARLDPTFQQDTSLGLIEAFLNPLAFDQDGALTAEEAAGAIVRGTTRQVGNEIDEFKTEALRNNLLGLPLDLAAINLTRARETGVPTLNAARATFFTWTGDSQLKPYASWVEFMQNLRHPESLVNFVAAYGTHAAITSATTLAGKREAANLLVFGDGDDADGVTIAGVTYTDRLDFLYSAGTWANDSGRPKDFDGVTTTGLGNVDLWIGGLAEQIMPFGGMLGSTFNYVFENQLEKLQNGDRFYYLERTANLNFLTELEGNSFAKLIMANTDTTHLPGDVFSTPAFILEVDQTRQFNADVVLPGSDGVLGDDPDTPEDESLDDIADPNADPVDTTNPLEPLVIRNNPTATDNPLTPFNEATTNYLEYTGVDHVVLGGTDGDDILIASIGDDTVWGDGGNDRIDGGDGVDQIRGGAGDDIITDLGGDDNLQGGDGNDAIHGGNGVDLIIGGFGNDFIVTGEDGDESFGGPGSDFFLGDEADEMVFGNEGDDWIEGGMADGSAGENFDTRGLDLIVGHDVFIDSMFPDRMNGEGGDDIMVGSQGGQVDRFIGGSGFDWASFQGDALAADVDLNLRAFDETPVPLSIASALSRFESTEGLSGSARSDILRGDDQDATTIPFSGAQGSTLTNFALILGLQALVDGLLGAGQTSFSAGNIILGGAGSDIIEGRGGDDLIDGDHWLSVRISVRENADGTGAEIRSVTSITELVDDVFAGLINPGQLVIVREILPDNTTLDFDTAQFSDLRANYVISVNGVQVAGSAIAIADGDVVTVAHLIDDDGDGVPETPGIDGSDTLRHIERLQFADQTIVLRDGLNAEPVGQLVILDEEGDPIGATAPIQGQVLTVSIAGVTDADNVGPDNATGAIRGTVSYTWQFDPRGDGVFEDIVIATGLGDLRVTGPTLTVPPDVAGAAIRVKALYEDAHGVLETVLSAATAPVQGINAPATGAPAIDDTTPTEGVALTAIIAGISDPNGTDDAVAGGLFMFRWQQSSDGVDWVDAANAAVGDDGTGQLFVPGPDQVGLMLRVVVTFADDGGTVETVFSLPTQPVADDLVFVLTEDADTFTGTAGADQIWGLGGGDNLFGLAGNDQIFGGLGHDFIDGGTGADEMWDSEGGDDTYVVDDAGDQVFEFAGQGTDTVRTTLDAYTLGPAGELDTGHVENLTFIGAGDFTGTGNELANVITAGAGDDTLDGGAGNDTLLGNAGNDTLGGGAGNDTLNGGAGTDTASYAGEAGAMFVSLVAGTARRGAAGAPVEDSLVSIENVTGGAGNDTLTGNGSANVLGGGAGNDTLTGNGGNDTLLGGLGNDTLNGGAGSDTASYAGETDAMFVSLAGGTARRGAAAAAIEDTLAAIENVTGGAGSDTLTGNGNANILGGGAGNDTLAGGGGVDTLDGGAGNDTFTYTFGDGADAVDGGTGSDTLDIAGTSGGNTLDVIFNGAAITGFEGGTVANVEAIGASLLGGTDTLSYAGSTAGVTVDLGAGSASGFAAIAGIENVTGGAGNDTLAGGDGANRLAGGAGNDTYFAGQGDTVVESGNGGVDWVFFTGASFSLGGNVENLTYTGAGNFAGTGNGLANVLTGNGGNDILNGNGGNDTLNGNGGNDNLGGGGGNDVLVGGAGNDIMNGGAGTDTFVFAPGFGNDIVAGFDANPSGGQDRLDLSALGITAASFAASVDITDLGSSTLVEIDVGGLGTVTGSILLQGVNGAGANLITQQDFILA